MRRYYSNLLDRRDSSRDIIYISAPCDWLDSSCKKTFCYGHRLGFSSISPTFLPMQRLHARRGAHYLEQFNKIIVDNCVWTRRLGIVVNLGLFRWTIITIISRHLEESRVYFSKNLKHFDKPCSFYYHSQKKKGSWRQNFKLAQRGGRRKTCIRELWIFLQKGGLLIFLQMEEFKTFVQNIQKLKRCIILKIHMHKWIKWLDAKLQSYLQRNQTSYELGIFMGTFLWNVDWKHEQRWEK